MKCKCLIELSPITFHSQVQHLQHHSCLMMFKTSGKQVVGFQKALKKLYKSSYQKYITKPMTFLKFLFLKHNKHLNIFHSNLSISDNSNSNPLFSNNRHQVEGKNPSAVLPLTSSTLMDLAFKKFPLI